MFRVVRKHEIRDHMEVSACLKTAREAVKSASVSAGNRGWVSHW